MLERQTEKRAPALTFVASVSLTFEGPFWAGKTPAGVAFHVELRGSVEGPELKGRVPRSSAHLLLDRDGIGTLQLRAPLLLGDGVTAALEATGRCDFGEGSAALVDAKALPDAPFGWCPRLLCDHPRYRWLNRVLHVGVGEIRLRAGRLDYDLYALRPSL